ncbi:MAG: hypothetical protein Q8K59_10400 [Nitrosomonas sp.]|nr:hypothetical protein [Nitrosomonas sp.]MDP1951483.1 hypothetical protein [Nitrosomonas sp.]
MVTKRGKQAGRKAAARKYGFLEVPLIGKSYLDYAHNNMPFAMITKVRQHNPFNDAFNSNSWNMMVSPEQYSLKLPLKVE